MKNWIQTKEGKVPLKRSKIDAQNTVNCSLRMMEAETKTIDSTLISEVF